MVCAWCGCHLPDHIPCRRPQPVFRGRPPRRQFAALAYRLRSPWSAAPMAHESIEGERVPTEMCDHSHQKPRRIVGQHEQARTPGPRSGGASAACDERRRTSSVVPDASRACGARSRARPREISCVPSSLAAEGLAVPIRISGILVAYLSVSYPGANRARNSRLRLRLRGGASSGRVFRRQ